MCRKEIFDLLGITFFTYRNLVTRTDFTLPSCLYKLKKKYVYDSEVILEWAATDPVKNAKPRETELIQVDLAMSKLFFAGEFDREELKNRYKFKKLASKYTKPKTTTVHLECDFAI